MNILERKIHGILKEKKELNIKISELQNIYKQKDKELEEIKKMFNFDVVRCKTCFGAGFVTESSGYGGVNTNRYKCGNCNESGFIIVEL